MIIIQVRTYEVHPKGDEDPMELVYTTNSSLIDVSNYTMEEWEEWMNTEIEVRLQKGEDKSRH
jgi:hypothetical protein